MAQFMFTIMRWSLFLALLQLGEGAGPARLRARSRRDVDTLASGIKRPPQAPYIFNDTADSIKQIGKTCAANEAAIVHSILDSVSPDDATFDNVILPYLRNEQENNAVRYGLIPYALSGKSDLSSALNEERNIVSAAIQDTFTNEAFFKLVDHVYHADAKNPALSEEDRIVLSSVWSNFAGTGLNLAAAQREQFNNLSARLGELANGFYSNANKPKYVYFTTQELDGVPADILQILKKADDTGENAGKLYFDVQVGTTYASVMSSAVNGTTRYVTSLAHEQIAPDNEPILKELIGLRMQFAQLFNYTTWADYKLASNIAKNKETVNAFIEDIRTHIAAVNAKDVASIAQFKSKDTTLVDPVGDKSVAYRWDYYRYPEIERQTLYKIDRDHIKDYFPVNFTTAAILAFYGEIYGIRFDRIEGQDADDLSPTGKGSDLLWHPDVLLYAVWDDDHGSGYDPRILDPGFRGYIFLDLFYREGVKSPAESNEQMFGPGFRRADGSLHYPSVRVLTSFIKSAQEDIKPSLFEYDRLHLFMHELGHGMHDLLSVTDYTRTHGTYVPIDFVETPARFMENYSLVPKAIKSIARHWSSFSPQAAAEWRKDQGGADPDDIPLPPATMPDDLIANLTGSARVNRAADQMNILFLMKYDQEISQVSNPDEVSAIDLNVAWNTLQRNYTQLQDPSDLGQGLRWGYGELSQGFLVSSYGGSTYTYTWCASYAQDIFETAFAADPFNREVGMRYRTQVLQPGASKDPVELLRNFLERQPNNNGFYKFVGVDGY
ncbi:unnamed protein product [Zymoseptoria tritici ST99CH_1E4]|uniref:Peptidase M3A/M3B catalytic domain-containing protein n=1 Tax=Zymoseptoria tritici ST99CH_1E4 TaxID=1276532 RepID=A0A2H1GXN5_ZYMTR|nr:unnamed protein product [Zymoseptoria tritici ST99CH_1E4]